MFGLFNSFAAQQAAEDQAAQGNGDENSAEDENED